MALNCRHLGYLRVSWGGSGYHMGGCQNYGPFLAPYYDTAPNYYLGYPKRDPNFDNYPCRTSGAFRELKGLGLGFRGLAFRGLAFRVRF